MHKENWTENRTKKRAKFSLRPILPGPGFLGPLKDLAQDLTTKSAWLEGMVALQTARAIGDRLRLINSYYSNLIEGHKTTISQVVRALKKDFSGDESARYAQELCRAHVLSERELMDGLGVAGLEVTSPAYIQKIHALFYAHLPEAHQFASHSDGFTDIPVAPGQFRDRSVSFDGLHAHGPEATDVGAAMDWLHASYRSDNFHGDEKVIAAAAAHHRLTFIHPFRDGNGRVSRLFTGLCLARSGLNTGNLWSLSRGLSKRKSEYMSSLRYADSPEIGFVEGQGVLIEEQLADFCQFILETCVDQVEFMRTILGLQEINARIDWYVEKRASQTDRPLPKLAPRLLRALFAEGEIPRARAKEILGVHEKTASRVVSALHAEGLVESRSSRAPLVVGLPEHILQYYFPSLFEPALLGEEYTRMVLPPKKNPASAARN